MEIRRLNKDEYAGKTSVKQIAEDIAFFAKTSFDESWNGNQHIANKAFKKCEKIKKDIADNYSFLRELVEYMLSSDDIHMRRQGMMIALSTGIKKDDALLELKREIALQDSNDIYLKRIGFEAEMIKKNIERNGYIKMFSSQSKYELYDDFL